MAEDFTSYLPHIRERWLAEQADWERRRERAWQSARRAAAVLQDEFGARRVLAFGSLVRSGPYDSHSDVDLAVSGIAARDFFRASASAAAVSDLDLDLVDLNDCQPSLRERILQEGVEL